MMPKPALGTAAAAIRRRRRQIELREAIAKATAKQRDYFRCRACGVSALGSLTGQLEAAHIHGKGMGGDHGRRSHKPSDYVTLCADCHRGSRSVHSGHLRIVAGHKGGNGVVRFVPVTPKGVRA